MINTSSSRPTSLLAIELPNKELSNAPGAATTLVNEPSPSAGPDVAQTLAPPNAPAVANGQTSIEVIDHTTPEEHDPFKVELLPPHRVSYPSGEESYRGKMVVPLFTGSLAKECSLAVKYLGTRRHFFHSVDDELIHLSACRTKIKKPKRGALLNELDAASVFIALSELANGPELKPKKPTTSLINSIYERSEYPELRPLRGIRTFTFARRDGTLVTQAGYDPDSEYILSPRRSIVIPRGVSRQRARELVDKVLDLFTDFPLDSKARAKVLALIVTIILRPAMRRSPVFCVDANVSGAGKTMMVAICVCIASGFNPKLVPWRSEESEQEKTLVSVLQDGAPAVLFDNVTGPIGGSVLEAVLSANRQISLRPLGQGRNVVVSTETVLAFSGNGLVIASDMRRRTIKVLLSSDLENPHLRRPSEFKYPQLEDTVEARAEELNTWLLTALQAYEDDERPTGTGVVLAGFEEWTRLVSGFVQWLGLGDVCEDIADLNDQDPETQILAVILPALRAADTKATGLSATDIASLPAVMKSSVLDDFRLPNGSLNAKRWGNRLIKLKTRNVGGLKLVPRDGKVGGKVQWRAVPVSPSNSSERGN